MISLQNITVSYGSFDLLKGISFHISDSDKIGLVGRNGAGKSTLMKLIIGEQAPTSGGVSVPLGCKIGYLPQIMAHNKGRSVIDEVMSIYDSTFVSEEEKDENKKYLAEKTLMQLGFKIEEFGRDTSTFSEGWNMRIELAKILLREPDVLLLDEPTNHLDIESIEWFEGYLKAFHGPVLLVSHDRKFLDNVTNRTVEILLGNIHDYKVSYSKYVELRRERIAQQTAAWENQQRMIEKTEDFIRRFRYKPTKSNQVQSRIKALEKLERIEIDDVDSSRIAVKFPPAARSGDVVYKAVGLSAGYPGKVVFTGADVEIRRGEKVAFVGRNGEGKTTLMRIIMGQLEPIDGQSTLGHNVKVGYYAQNQEDVLDGSETVFSTLDRVAVGEMRTRLRDLLAAFLFRGDDIDKKVSVLSGGERARLAMAKLMLTPCNLLALDEPTNHMDIASKDVLKEALKAYDGTLIVVSHDRDFLQGLVDKVYEVRDGAVKEHLGGIEDFLRRRRLSSLSELERAAEPQKSSVPEKSSGAVGYEQRKAQSREQRRQRQRVEFLEKEIAKLEEKMKGIEAILEAPSEKDDVMELTRDYLECKIALDKYTEEWIEIA